MISAGSVLKQGDMQKGERLLPRVSADRGLQDERDESPGETAGALPLRAHAKETFIPDAAATTKATLRKRTKFGANQSLEQRGEHLFDSEIQSVDMEFAIGLAMVPIVRSEISIRPGSAPIELLRNRHRKQAG